MTQLVPLVRGSDPIRVALADSHPQHRMSLLSMLGREQNIDVVGCARKGASFLCLVRELRPDVVVVDPELPDMEGAELVREISSAAPASRCLAVTDRDDRQRVIDIMFAGVVGYLLKCDVTERLISSIFEAAVWLNPMSSRVSGYLLSQARAQKPPVALTPRESEMVSNLVEGRSYNDCAEKMGISLGTVQDYVKRVYRKLGVSSKAEAAAWYRRHHNWP